VGWLLGLVGLGLVGWLVGWLVGQLVNQTINQATRDNQPTNPQPTPNQRPSKLSARSCFFLVPSMRQVLVPVFPWVGLLVLVGLGWSVDWLVGRLASWLVGHMVNQTVNWL